MSVSYLGGALTLDEFSLWLNLDPNDYWSRPRDISIDAVILHSATFWRWGRGAHHSSAGCRLWASAGFSAAERDRAAGNAYSARAVASSRVELVDPCRRTWR